MKTTAEVRDSWAQLWLPFWPLASDDLREGIYRMSRECALDRRYVEANPQAVSNLLVVDVDHGDAALRALSNRPLPNAVVENPTNGHAHAVYALAEPVTRTEYAHRKPLAYAAAVTEGLRRNYYQQLIDKYYRPGPTLEYTAIVDLTDELIVGTPTPSPLGEGWGEASPITKL